MRVTVVSVGNPLHQARWSGSARSICLALEKVASDLDFVSGIWLSHAGQLINRILALIGIAGDVRHSRFFAWWSGLYVSILVGSKKPDLVVAIAASPFVAFLRTEAPIVYISDATFQSIQELYPSFGRFPAWLRRDGDRIEALALQNAWRVVYPSRWASASAMNDYGVGADKIVVTPFGANLPSDAIPQAIKPKVLPAAGLVRLLYVSVDWERKRGDIVIETVRLLKARGVLAKAYLVGNIPDSIRSDSGVEVVGYVRKSEPAGLARLVELYRDAHFFILPTMADCFGTVFSEAQAFGCPSLSYNVGGTADALQDGKLGALLKLGAPAEAFADWIVAMLANPVAYERMSAACRSHYEQSANWDAFVRATTGDLPAP